VEHDYRNKFNLRPVPGFDGAPAALAGLRRASSFHAFAVYFGTVAGGDEDVVDTDRRRALRESTGALAVAWEGAGGARACAFSGVPFVEIRAVTDTANQDAPADFSSNLKVAMRNLGRFLAAWIQST
jgi:adenosylhomocysteine nucleosidase